MTEQEKTGDDLFMQLYVRPASVMLPYRGDPKAKAEKIVAKLDKLGIEASAIYHVDGFEIKISNHKK